ncbi:MAG TPA: outer membrane beta-barrel protein [Cyclobacteriaceae bacterium]|nr:outer membrane beta-barrel protein [Cyclobacteriaceae bacterium]
MKKIVTIIAFALICSGAFAQFNQGRYLVGGSLGFSATTTKAKSDNATNTLSHHTDLFVSPDIGYFVIDNLAVGAGLGLSVGSTKGDGNDNSKTTSTTFTLSPFVRYYLDPGVFFQGQVGFGSESEKRKATGSNTTVTTKYGVFNWSLAAGYAYFLNDFVAIEPMVGFRSNSLKDSDADVKYLNGGIFINVGFQIYLGPRN